MIYNKRSNIVKMTAYHGGKQKIGRDIALSIQRACEAKEFIPDYYCEPFVGMCGVTCHIPDVFPSTKIVAGDVNESLILMWKEAMNGWTPPTSFLRIEYETLKTQMPSALRGFVGHAYSFGGLFFGSYRDDYYSDGRKTGSERSSNRVVSIASSLKGITEFTVGSYTQFSNLRNSVIYCDPPYKKCSKYYEDTPQHRIRSFDHTSFWKWCVDMRKNNNLVFVSEYSLPSSSVVNVKCEEVFCKETTTSYSQTRVQNKEKLFLIN
jgi:site-specific DNA-adenine methylase